MFVCECLCACLCVSGVCVRVFVCACLFMFWWCGEGVVEGVLDKATSKCFRLKHQQPSVEKYFKVPTLSNTSEATCKSTCRKLNPYNPIPLT